MAIALLLLLLHDLTLASEAAPALASAEVQAAAAQPRAPRMVQVKWQKKRTSFQEQRICVGDSIRFNWTGTHSVWLSTAAAPCKPSRRLSKANAKSYTFTATTNGTFNFMCGISDHCTSGNMRITVTAQQCGSSQPVISSSPSPAPMLQPRVQLVDDNYTVGWNHELYVHDSAGVLANDGLVAGCNVTASLALGPYPVEDATPGDGSGWPILKMEPSGAFRVAKMGFAGVKVFYYQVTDCNGNPGEPLYGKVTVTFEPDPAVSWANPDSYSTPFGTTLKVGGAGSSQGLFMNDKPPVDCSTGGPAAAFRLDRLAGGSFVDYQVVGGEFVGDIWEGDARRQSSSGGDGDGAAGRVVVHQDGSFLFFPARGFVGTAAFQYTVMDTCNFVASNSGRVTVEVQPPPDLAAILNGTGPATLDPNSPLRQLCDGKTFLPGTEQPDGSGTYCEIAANGTLVLGTGQKALGLTGEKILRIAMKCSVTLSMVNSLIRVIEDPNVAKNDWHSWLQVLAAGASSPVCCIGSILPRLFEMLFLGYADAVVAYPSKRRSLADAGNTFLLMALHSQVPVTDLQQVVVHYGHVMPPTIFSVGCMTLGYHIYCPEEQIVPSLLLHEMTHVSQFVNSAGRSVAQFGRIYLQQYCDAGYYEGIAWEREAYEREKILYPAPGDAPSMASRPGRGEGGVCLRHAVGHIIIGRDKNDALLLDMTRM